MGVVCGLWPENYLTEWSVW